MGYGGGGGRRRGRGRGRGRGALPGTSVQRMKNPDHEIEMLRVQAKTILSRIQSVNTLISEIQAPKAPASGVGVESDKRTAVVDLERCVGCGICIDACPEGAITVENAAMIDRQKCTGCGMCVDECPNEAISLTD